MTIAELVILIAVASLLYRILSPLRRRLEKQLYGFFRGKSPQRHRPVIDITHYQKKKGPDHET